MNRRSFIAGILALGMAPAVVKAGSIMRVRPIVPVSYGGIKLLINELGVFQGISFYETTITIDQMRAATDVMRRQHIPPDPDGNYWASMTKRHKQQWMKEIARSDKRLDWATAQYA